MSRWRGRLPGRLPRRSAARRWCSRSDAQTEAALQHMPVSASWAPRRNAVLGAQLKACALNRAAGDSRSSIFGARPVSGQVEQSSSPSHNGPARCAAIAVLARPSLSCRACPRRPAGPGPGRTRSPSVATWRWPGCGPVMPVCSANDPATCCREVLRGWHSWLEHPARTGRAERGHRNRRPFALSYGRLTDVASEDPRSPRLPSRRRRLRLAERRRWRGPTPRDARSSG
jgi:hypothetical protein